jgi:hypothetical protein
VRLLRPTRCVCKIRHLENLRYKFVIFTDVIKATIGDSQETSVDVLGRYMT